MIGKIGSVLAVFQDCYEQMTLLHSWSLNTFWTLAWSRAIGCPKSVRGFAAGALSEARHFPSRLLVGALLSVQLSPESQVASECTAGACPARFPFCSLLCDYLIDGAEPAILLEVAFSLAFLSPPFCQRPRRLSP